MLRTDKVLLFSKAFKMRAIAVSPSLFPSKLRISILNKTKQIM